MDDSFKKVPLQVPKLSGFDKSHQNLLTSKVGTITPILVDELIPGSRVNLKLALSAQLPPLASDTFMRCSVKCEAFFVPMRLLCGSFESWFTDEPRLDLVDQEDSGWTDDSRKGMLPVIMDTKPINQGVDSWTGYFNATGSLADYLGFKSTNPNFLKSGISALPFLAYHKVYDDWYRNTLVQRPVFVHPSPNWPANAYAASAPYLFADPVNYIYSSLSSMLLADNVYLWELRQRNFGLDYFTTATPEPQQGDASRVSFEIPASGPGSFSVAALRAANSYQQFKERNNIAGNYYPDQIEARYNVRLSDGVAQRSLYLGRAEFEVYSKGIYQTSQDVQQGTSDATQTASGSSNPFATVGSRYGSAYAAGENFIVNFESKEPGYLFVMATLVPRVTYSSGVRRMLMHYRGEGSLVDMANPILQSVGPQPIFQYELNGQFPGLPGGGTPGVFGYTDRYAEFKTMEDELHGLLRDGQSLESFALQRGFSYSDGVEISSDFLKIPVDYLDQVTAVRGDLSKFGYWADCFFNYRVAMPISKYSLPTLQDPAYEHGATVVVNRGGTKL